MKLFCITDFDGLENNWEKSIEDSQYQYSSVEITFYNLNITSWEEVMQKMKEERFHLCLSLFKCDVIDENLKQNVLLNAVNNYCSKDFENDFSDIEIQNQPFIVNKTTSYFNVFLEIGKCISFTAISKNYEEELYEKKLSNLLIISSINYKLANLFASNRCNYYLLNYASESSSLDLVAAQFQDVVSKLD